MAAEVPLTYHAGKSKEIVLTRATQRLGISQVIQAESDAFFN